MNKLFLPKRQFRYLGQSRRSAAIRRLIVYRRIADKWSALACRAMQISEIGQKEPFTRGVAMTWKDRLTFRMQPSIRKERLLIRWHTVEQGKLTCQKPSLKPRRNWAIRTRLQMSCHVRELAPFNLEIDRKLLACDPTRLQVQNVCMGVHVVSWATVMQQKTQRVMQFKITEQMRCCVSAWIAARKLKCANFLFPSRISASPHFSTHQYARIDYRWVASIGLHGGRFIKYSLGCAHMDS